jgi:hypothetical protein
VGGSTCSTASGSAAIQDAVHASCPVSNHERAVLDVPSPAQSVTCQVYRVRGRSGGPAYLTPIAAGSSSRPLDHRPSTSTRQATGSAPLSRQDSSGAEAPVPTSVPSGVARWSQDRP